MKEQQKNKELPDLKECQKCGEYLNGWKRAKADLINYKKEEGQRMEEFGKYNRQAFVFNLLPIMDSLDLAEKNLSKDLKSDEQVKGLLMIKKQLEDFLKANGVEAIAAQGEKFNPELHEAAQMEECPGEESGTIIEEIQKGYMIDGCLLRPAKVKVAK
ncbi:MAG: nucleotide exchange factor GrpE [Minisyncoccales bacterium]